MNQEEAWSNRYRVAGDDYLFGTEPNKFLAERTHLFDESHQVLSLADGEGRNSVWLARNGVQVTANEISSVALKKAQQLAKQNHVSVNFIQSDMLTQDWYTDGLHNKFDWVLGIFIQFVDAEGRNKQFNVIKNLTCSGGRVLLHGYTPKQLDYGTGGPSTIDNLYTKEILLKYFSDWNIEEILEYEEVISEGAGHLGQSALIGMIARKP